MNTGNTCKYCNSSTNLSVIRVSGDGPHKAKLVCNNCNRFLNWTKARPDTNTVIPTTEYKFISGRFKNNF